MNLSEMLQHSGMCALVGRPNVGKSTLLNALLGQKVSIVTRRAQTTRHRILGVAHRGEAQIVFVDTPGIHKGAKKALNRRLNRAALGVLADVDVAVMVTRELQWTDEDQAVADALREASIPAIAAVNQVDLIKDKAALLPYLERLGAMDLFQAIVPISALRRVNLEALEAEVVSRLPPGPPFYPTDTITDRGLAFRLGELVREQLMSVLGEEVPYATTVQVEALEQEGRLTRLSAVIWVEREAQKPIVIGRGGKRLKRIGREAREEMERITGGKVHLELWVKVREGWTTDERAVSEFGY